MKINTNHVLFLLIISAFIVSCATTLSNASSNIHKHEMKLALHPENHTFSNVRIRHYNGLAVLHGSIKHNHRDSEVDAHVDIAVLDAEGNILYRGSTAVSTARLRGQYRIADFEHSFPDATTKDTIVHVAYHSYRYNTKKAHDCEKNQAVEMGVKK